MTASVLSILSFTRESKASTLLIKCSTALSRFSMRCNFDSKVETITSKTLKRYCSLKINCSKWNAAIEKWKSLLFYYISIKSARLRRKYKKMSFEIHFIEIIYYAYNLCSWYTLWGDIIYASITDIASTDRMIWRVRDRCSAARNKDVSASMVIIYSSGLVQVYRWNC